MLATRASSSESKEVPVWLPTVPNRPFEPPLLILSIVKKIVYSFIAVYTLNRLAGYKLAAPGALAHAKVKLYHGKAPCGRYQRLKRL